MFGYVRPCAEELLVKDHEFYKATYCGVCRSMRAHTGKLSAIGLSYDSVFLALARFCYTPEKDFSAERCRCIAHPFKKRCMLCENAALSYTARAFAILTYEKLLDDLKDEPFFRRLSRRLALPIFRRAKKKADLPDLAGFIHRKLDEIGGLEKNKTASVDLPANLFGELLGEVFAYRTEGDAAVILRSLGEHLGRFIYAADAAEDYERDRKSGNYNPYVLLYEGKPLTAENKATIRCALLLECRAMERAVDLLPFGGRATVGRLMRNIVGEGLARRVGFLDADGEAGSPAAKKKSKHPRKDHRRKEPTP